MYILLVIDYDLILYQVGFLAFIQPKFKAIHRVGPHNIDIISIFTGSLLGDGHMYKHNNNSYRIRFEQGYKHKDYLFWLFRSIKNLGYANSLPKLLINESNNRKNYYFYTYTYTSLYFIYNQFYFNNIKKLPDYLFLNQYLTPQALAIWIMDDGTGLTIETHCFTLKEVELLCELLNKKYSIICKPNKSYNKWHIHISEKSMKDLII